MVDCIAPPQARITVAPAGHHVAVTVASLRPSICTLTHSQAKALARDLLDVAGALETSTRVDNRDARPETCNRIHNVGAHRQSVDLVTLRGMTLHAWRDGQEAAQVTLSIGAALTLLADLANAIRGRA